jgi:hypothetical protein
LSGQSERYYIAAIAAAGKVLQHLVPLAASQRTLGEGSEQIGIRMRFCRRSCWPLQSRLHDLGKVLH